MLSDLDDGTGELLAWRINGHVMTLVDEAAYGHFHSDDTLVFL
jgi:hypothetical protein